MRVIQPLPPQMLDPAAAADVPARRNRFSVQRMAGSMPRWQPKAPEATNFTGPAEGPKVETGVSTEQKFGFKDLIDAINPLQHIPLVNVAYRKLTGDQISAPAQFMGGFLFGGPVGGVAAVADIAMRERTGQSFGDHAYAVINKSGSGNAPARVELTARRKEEPRMAGYVPVWGQENPVALAQADRNTVVPAGHLSQETKFAMLLNTLSDNNHNIS